MDPFNYLEQDQLQNFDYLNQQPDPRTQSYPPFVYAQQPSAWQPMGLEESMGGEQGMAQNQHQQHNYVSPASSTQHQHQQPRHQHQMQRQQQHQSQQGSRPNSNHGHPTPINMQSAGLAMDYSNMMPTDWQFQFQQAAAVAAQQQQQQQQHFMPQQDASLALNTYNPAAFTGQLQASPVNFMPVSAPENFAVTAGMDAANFMTMAGPMESMNAAVYPLGNYSNDFGSSFTLSLQNALNQQATESVHSSVPGSSPTGTSLEVQSLSDNEWSAINYNPNRQSIDSFSGTVSNPSQNLHIRTNSDSSSSEGPSSAYLSGSYEEIPPWPLSSPHEEFNNHDFINSHYLQTHGMPMASHEHSHPPHASPPSSLAVSPTTGAAGASYMSSGSSSASPTSSGPTSPPLRRRKSRTEIGNKVTKVVKKVSPTTTRKDANAEKKVGRRRGPLRPDQRQQAHEIRKLRACLRCKFLKKTCDKGEPCGGCRPSHARLWQVPCTRLDIKDIGYFLTGWKADYERHVSLGFSVNNIKGFSTMERTLYITHGYGHYLPINAREVFVREDKCFDVDWVESISGKDYEVTTPKLTAGMEGVSTALLSEYLDRHLDHDFEKFVDDYFEGTPFITEILKTAHRYYQKEKVPAIRKALKLVVAYNLTLHITMVEGLEEEGIGRIEDPESKFSGKTLAPVMINFQVKCALADMWRELQKDILEELSSLYSSVYSGDKLKNWPKIFMLATILLAIWEEMQFDCHYRVMDEDAVNKFCDDMEKTPVGVIVGLFQAISTKLPSLQEWDTRKHHQLLGSNTAICDALTEVRQHINQHEKFLKEQANAKFDRSDFDSLSGKFMSKLVIRAN